MGFARTFVSMLKLIAITAALALLTLAPAGASAHFAGKGKRCGAVVFTPNTDHGASAIRARGVTCRKARRMVRAYENGDKTPAGFTCRARPHDPDNGIAHSDVLCRRGTKRVSWATS
jgi:hypothetical protein